MADHGSTAATSPLKESPSQEVLDVQQRPTAVSLRSAFLLPCCTRAHPLLTGQVFHRTDALAAIVQECLLSGNTAV